MLRRLLFAGVLAASAAACGGSSKPRPIAKTVQRPPPNQGAPALLANARASAQAGDLDAAEVAYERAYAATPTLDVLAERVQFLIRAGRAGRAVDIAKAYVDVNAATVPGHALYAETLLVRGDGPGARKIAEAMIKMDAAHPSGYEKLGRALILLDATDEGLAKLRIAVGKAGKDKAAYEIALGLALVTARDTDGGEAALRAAVKAEPRNATAHAYLGMALREREKYDEAKQELDRALEIDPNHARAYFELGLLFNAQGRQADAEQALSKAVQRSPNESLFWYAYGEIYRLQQRTDEAISAYRKALDLDPPYHKGKSKLGMLLAARKDYGEAEGLLKDSANREPRNPANYLALGELYVATRNTKDAIANLERYLALAPRDDRDGRARAKKQLAVLKRRRAR